MRLVVQKYGGTSVGTPERICHVAQRILETQRQGCRVVAVVSAMAGVTDEFLRLGDAVALTRGGPGSGSEDKRYIYSYR